MKQPPYLQEKGTEMYMCVYEALWGFANPLKGHGVCLKHPSISVRKDAEMCVCVDVPLKATGSFVMHPYARRKKIEMSVSMCVQSPLVIGPL